MKLHSLTRTAASVALLTAVSACGGAVGGLGGGGADGFVSNTSIAGTSVSTMASNLVMEPNKARAFDAAATMGDMGGNDGARRIDGGIVFGQTAMVEGKEGDREGAGVQYSFDADGNGGAFKNGDLTSDAVGMYDPKPVDTDTVFTTNRRIGGGTANEVLIETREGDTVVYTPRDGSRIYAGGLAHQSGMTNGYGVFGRRTTGTEVNQMRATQQGSVEYNGVARASAGTSGGVKDYEGTATATIDFSRGNTVSADITLKDIGQSPDRVTVAMSNGQIGANGAVTGDATYSGTILPNEGAFAGDFRGYLFGPNGETLAGTFYGSTTQDGGGAIAGHTIMNAAGN